MTVKDVLKRARIAALHDWRAIQHAARMWPDKEDVRRARYDEIAFWPDFEEQEGAH